MSGMMHTKQSLRSFLPVLTMASFILSLLVPTILAYHELSTGSLNCDFQSERRIVQDCLMPLVDKFNFEQLFFGQRFIDAHFVLCKFYDEYSDCTAKFREECRVLDTQAEHLLRSICSRSFTKHVDENRSCLDKYSDYFVNSLECSNGNMFRIDKEIPFFRTENNEISDRRCSFVQWYLNCNLNDTYIEACPVSAEMIRTYYELLLNANQSNCDLRRQYSNLSATNFTDFDNFTELSGNLTETDLLHLGKGDVIKRCDLVSERYVIKGADKIRKLEDVGYFLFQAPFQEIVNRTPCRAYRKYRDSVQNIAPQCRRMNRHLEKVYDYYCSDEILDLFSNQQSCIDQLQVIYNGSDCLNNDHFQDEYNNILSELDTSDLVSRRCNFTRWYVDCGISESFVEVCPEITQSVQTYFELLINANQSNCGLRQPLADRNTTADDTDNFDCKIYNNCTTVCPDGFYKQGAKCVDVDECASNEHFCSQKCINKPGGYECQCDVNFYKLARNGRQCLRTDTEAPLFFLAHSQSIWNITHDAKYYQKLLPNQGAEKVVMFDYDYKDHVLYYVDLTRSVIEYVTLDGSKKVTTVQNHDVEGTEGIAVDWVHRNLYTLRWHQLHVQRLNGRYRTSLYRGLFRLPRALVAHPQTRELFASDWSEKPFIARLAMDGSEARKIITEDLVWPNALAVDYFAQRLYWADAFRDVIEMANLDGTGRRPIITNNAQVPHVFGLSVFDDAMFWSDWTNRGLLFANKMTGHNLTMLVGTVLQPYSIKTFHRVMQMSGPNLCEATKCEHLCVPGLDGSGTRCLCADGFVLQKDGSCRANCAKHEFLCSRPDHKCLNLIYRCDGTFNCNGGEDEIGCPVPICMQDEQMFPCRDNRKCILRSQRCDGFRDCLDSSDEVYCADLAMTWSH